MEYTETVHAWVVHASPGRIRLRVRPADFEGSAIGSAERALASIATVRAVQVNPVVHSIVVTFDARAASTEDLLSDIGRAIQLVPSEVEPVRQGPPLRRLDESIVTFFRAADQQIEKKTGGFADLRTLLPVGLAALAAREFLAGRLIAVPWYALLWYSFDSFHKLKKPASPDLGPTDG
jgi:hypothetical protein